MGTSVPAPRFFLCLLEERVDTELALTPVTNPAPLESGIINYRAAIRMMLANSFSSPFLCEHYGGGGLLSALRTEII